MVGFCAHAIADFLHWHIGRPRQELRAYTLVPGFEVLHQNEGQAGIRGLRAQEPRKSLERSSGGANTDDRRDLPSGRRYLARGPTGQFVHNSGAPAYFGRG
jgi:hypothetical protein